MKKIVYMGLALTLMISAIIILITPKLVFAADSNVCSCTSTTGYVGPGCVLGHYTYENPCGGLDPAKHSNCEKGATGSTSNCFCHDECDDCDGVAGNDCSPPPIPD